MDYLVGKIVAVDGHKKDSPEKRAEKMAVVLKVTHSNRDYDTGLKRMTTIPSELEHPVIRVQWINPEDFSDDPDETEDEDEDMEREKVVRVPNDDIEDCGTDNLAYYDHKFALVEEN